MDENGHFIQFSSFIEKFNLKCFFREFSLICKAIPLPLKHMTPNALTHSNVSVKVSELKIGEVCSSERKCNNKAIGNGFSLKELKQLSSISTSFLHYCRLHL